MVKYVLLSALCLAVAPRIASAETEESSSVRISEWQLQIAPGAEFFVFGDTVVGNGPAFKLAAQRVWWISHFMIGSGPSLQYSSLIETEEPKDKIHQITFNGDFVIGGGSFEKFAIYAHLMLGLGIASVHDGETDDKLTTFWARAVGGLGGWVHITPKFSLGALVDVGWPGIVDALLTVGFHVGRQ